MDCFTRYGDIIMMLSAGGEKETRLVGELLAETQGGRSRDMCVDKLLAFTNEVADLGCSRRYK